MKAFNKWLQLALEFAAAGLIVAEITVLSKGVFWRYVLHQPLTWSDELASILFLWLAMLGAVVAMMRHSHMRLTTLVDCFSPSLRQITDALVLVLSFIF